MTHEMPVAADLEAKRNEVLLAYVEAYETGRVLDRAELLEANPGLREELKEFFEAHEQIERLAVGLRDFSEQEIPAESCDSERTPDIGRLGDFRLLKEIGRGGMGVVYQAEQVSLRRRVALKLLPFAAAIDPRHLQRFKNEALAAAHLRHENIVPVYAVGEDRGVHYYAMQFIEGRSLAAVISELKSAPTQDSTLSATSGRKLATDATSAAALRPTERFSGSRRYYDWVANLCRQAALALDYAHSVGIVHRDIKPANLLLDAQGQLWVTDFGLAQVAGDAGLTMSGELLGTLRYASPEQVLGRRGVVDHRSDIYSLGATLYELLTLAPIFDGRDRNELLRQIAQNEPILPRTVHSFIPWELETIVLKAINKEPCERYRTARDLAEDLQRFQDNRPILARRPGLGERLRKLARRHPSVFGASIAVLVLLSAGSMLSAILIRNEQQRTKLEQQNVQAAYVRELQRAEEADARFLLARRSVDDMFRISQEELADRPGLEGLRKRMLWSVLVYYQEFLEDRGDDPQARAELVDAKQRVEKILADLSVLRAACQLYLLVQPAVMDALQPNDQQRSRVKEFCARVGKEWMESFSEVGRLSPSERGRRAIERARSYESEMNRLFTPSQMARLREIGLQAQGFAAFREPEVVAELRLSAEQREQLRMIEEETMIARMKRPKPGARTDNANRSSNEAGTGSDSAPHASGSASDPMDAFPNNRILSVLNKDQQERWKSMIGEMLPVVILPFGAQ